MDPPRPPGHSVAKTNSVYRLRVRGAIFTVLRCGKSKRKIGKLDARRMKERHGKVESDTGIRFQVGGSLWWRSAQASEEETLSDLAFFTAPFCQRSISLVVA